MLRQGTNAFSCLVSRRGGDLFPVCWDAEGARSLLPLDFDDAQMRLSGRSSAEIDEAVAQRFKSGQYRPPSRAGVAYMLAPLRYRIDESGAITRTPSNPHLMFYGPNPDRRRYRRRPRLAGLHQPRWTGRHDDRAGRPNGACRD